MSDLETLKAWCHWKRKEVGRTKVMIDREGELELVDAVESVIAERDRLEKLYGQCFVVARELMAEDAYRLFVERMDEVRAKL